MKQLGLGLLFVVGLTAIWWLNGGRGNDSPRAGFASALEPKASLNPDDPVVLEQLPAAADAREHSGQAPLENQAEATEFSIAPLIPASGLFGQVTSEGGEPVSRREVKLAVISAGESYPMEGVWTDEDGHYACPFRAWQVWTLTAKLRRERLKQLDQTAQDPKKPMTAEQQRVLESLAQALRGPVWLEVSVEDAQGFQANRRIELRDNMPEPYRVDLCIRRTLGLKGEVLGELAGAPLADATLFDEEWNLLASSRTDQDGNFQIEAPPPGAYRLHARKEGSGAAQIEGLFLGPPMRAPHQKILLGGLAVLGAVVKNTRR